MTPMNPLEEQREAALAERMLAAGLFATAEPAYRWARVLLLLLESPLSHADIKALLRAEPEDRLYVPVGLRAYLERLPSSHKLRLNKRGRAFVRRAVGLEAAKAWIAERKKKDQYSREGAWLLQRFRRALNNAKVKNKPGVVELAERAISYVKFVEKRMAKLKGWPARTTFNQRGLKMYE
jgi:hypothetical protein